MSLPEGQKKKMQIILSMLSFPDRQIQTVILRRPNGRDFALRFGASPPTLEKMIPALDEGGLLPEFGCDIVVVRNGTDDLTQAVEFFTQVRQQPGRRKGLLRLKL